MGSASRERILINMEGGKKRKGKGRKIPLFMEEILYPEGKRRKGALLVITLFFPLFLSEKVFGVNFRRKEEGCDLCMIHRYLTKDYENETETGGNF